MTTEVVVYACQQAVPDPEALRRQWGKTGMRLQIIPEPCSSKVESFQLLRTLATPADLVWVIGCKEDLCRYSEGSHRLAGRVAYTRRYLEEIGLEPARAGHTLVTPGDVGELAAAVAAIKTEMKTLGASPLKEKGEKGKSAKGEKG